MPLRLYSHPLSSFCWKALIALYETGAPFEAELVNLGDPQARARFKALSPMGRIPALRDPDLGLDLFEATVIVEHLHDLHPAAGLLPSDPEVRREARLLDRVFDLYVQQSMQKIVGDVRRPDDAKDPAGVEQARSDLRTVYAFLQRRLADRRWAAGESFTLADCAAAPALYYADYAEPIGEEHGVVRAYRRRLTERPSVARAIEEAQPYWHFFPLAEKA